MELNRKLKGGIRWVFILSLLYIAGNFFIMGTTRHFHPYMSWNLFLAVVPLAFACLAIHFMKKSSRLLVGLFLVLWLLFYPNSPYIITDYIHISNQHEILVDKPLEDKPELKQRVFVFNDDFCIWVDFVIISTGVFLGVAAGFMSLKILEGLAMKKLGRGLSFFLVVLIHLLTGYAITIGRFERWNSWDVFNPVNIYKIIVTHLNMEAVKFTLLFSFMSLTVYLFLSIITSSFKEVE